MFATLLLLYKISRLFSNKRIINVISTIICVMPIMIFLQEGNYVEEYALPFISYALYTFIKFLKSDEIKYKEIFINGICLSIVLLLRPNMIALWIVFIPYIFFKFIKEKKHKELRENCFNIFRSNFYFNITNNYIFRCK